jgi:DNA-binding transcriptional ArsR family regulator
VPHTLQGFKAELFKALAHPARIKILEYLRSGERTVSELQVLLDLESSTVSQQLAILRARSIVEGRKQGTSVYYRVPDPLIFDVLDVARRIFANHVVGLQAMADGDPEISTPLTAAAVTSAHVTASDVDTDPSAAAAPSVAAEVAGADRP